MSAKRGRIPKITIERLSVYLQVLEQIQREGVAVVSSGPLAEACRVNASQLRKDLTYFGEFGIRGVGYNVDELINAVSRSLGIDREWNCVLIGVGNLGKAIIGQREFVRRGFRIIGAFDCDPFKIGEAFAGLEVVCTRHLKDRIRDKNVRIGVITTPPEHAQRVADYLVGAGIKGILNYAPMRITVPPDVTVEYVDIFHHLYSLAYDLALRQD
ncbi:MAG: redox-sensing transcriptional repressor Rex [Desulfovibrio sp.]|jgi:redox-sensing transcriptional repressor|nr:redox-sensing transcriptional repressor Rex [Desulfovibrio sp.]